ncbi:hypothetical protein [Rhizobium sp. ICMP 5592]|jgi:hypothetical protein|uniref:hypothetical protein n=1 Tax=Rhizobium sp. ICMP 5592 TaxID=2292445 RepID=UPI001297E99C|nr:hypothetical protein [Rhizobium sp. ICMP 5592]MQB46322.1 hypothetical protein [Rhizobium sp. ICMP 5592]
MESSAFIVKQDKHRSAVEASLAQAWPQRLAQAALHCFARHRSRLDLDEAPDVMKRDLGFLDGCAPYREDVRLR